MANFFPNCLFAVMQTYPENKASRRHSKSKWSRMQMSAITVKSTFTRKILVGVIIIHTDTSSPEVCHGLRGAGFAVRASRCGPRRAGFAVRASRCGLRRAGLSFPPFRLFLAGLHSILYCLHFGSTYPEIRVFSCIDIKTTLTLTPYTLTSKSCPRSEKFKGLRKPPCDFISKSCLRFMPIEQK